MKIIVDTREQLPLWQPCSTVLRQTLPVGDYSTIKLKDSFIIERKSPQDLYGSIIQNHVRFMNMLIRAKSMGIVIVVYVESSRKNFLSKNFPRGRDRKITSETLKKIVDTISKRKNLEIVWCTDRRCLTRKVLKRLKDEEKRAAAKSRVKATAANR